jgi:hypothetical protein
MGRVRLTHGFVIGIVLAASAVLPPLASPAQAAKPVAPQTLTHENFSGTPTFSNVACNSNGTSSFDYTVSGEATGPYPGPFTESGHVTIAQQDTVHELQFGPFTTRWRTGSVATLQASFAIESSAGTVTGTRILAQPGGTGSCQNTVQTFASGFSGTSPATFREADVDGISYQAMIATGKRTYCDHGRSVTQMGVGYIGEPFNVEIRRIEYHAAMGSDLGAAVRLHDHQTC